MKAVMANSIVLLGTSLELLQRQIVTIVPATNQPNWSKTPRLFFARPVDEKWSDGLDHDRDDSILIDEYDLMKSSPWEMH